MLTGTLKKLNSKLNGTNVQYCLNLEQNSIDLNELLDKKIEIKFTGQIFCQECAKIIKKTYSGGYCFPCSQKLACADFCILAPEKCHFDKGTCREPDWAQTHCFVPTIVYLANSSNVKIGLTRQTQIPTRWIDQGAKWALPIARLQNRKQAGILETLFKAEVSDKTNFRKMLKGEIEFVDLESKRDELFGLLENELDSFESEFEDDFEILENEVPVEINYPILSVPEKISSISLDKQDHISGVLKGIKGQYLIFEKKVFNIRKHIGYEVQFEY